MAAVTFDQIEDAIVSRLEDKLTARKVAVQKGAEGIPQPAVYVSIEAGRFEKVGQERFRQDLTVWVDIVFKHLGDEAQRRKGIYLILQGAILALTLQTLGLDMSPMTPKTFRNTTTEELKDLGLIVFSLELETSTYVTRVDDETVYDLLQIGLNYYLQPDDGNVDASDLVILDF